MTTVTAPGPALGGPRRRPRAVRTGEVIGWFVGVFCTYWIYWLIAVPLIEPGIEPDSVSRYGAGAANGPPPEMSQRKQALVQYFPPGSWELDNPAVWETDQTMLLFKRPEPQPDGTVKLQHCTLLFFPREGDGGTLAEPRPIIMRAERGASLKFDQPIELKTIDLAKRQLVGGNLHGLIRIERLPSQPGAGDDLLITTRDIELKGDRAVSPHPVHFRLGRSQGSGRDLEIQLHDDGRPGGAFRTGKVKTLLLKRDVVMNLALDDPAFARTGQRPGAAGDLSGSTLKVTCQGNFQYDFELHAASFHDRVDVARMSSGPSDLLNCELLNIYFRTSADKPAADAQPTPRETADNDQRPTNGDQPIRRIEARGDPVTLNSPSRGIYVKSLQGLDFEPIPGDQMGRIVGLGQGVMQGVAPGAAGNKFLVRWTREFRFEPTEGGQYVASLHGGANVRMPELGEITANDRLDAQGKLLQEGEIFVWATPLKAPPTSERVAVVRPVALRNGGPDPIQPNSAPAADKWQIDRVLAQGSVAVSTPQLDANTGKIEVWVERATAAPTPGAPPNNAPLADNAPPQQQPKPQSAPNAPPGQRYSVQAGSVQVKLVPNGKEFAVASLTLDNQAQLQELTPRPGARPLVVIGDRLHVAAANTEQTRVTVSGNLAQIDAGGMVLFGQSIELEKHTNRLWVDGAGQMVMPIQQDLNGQPLLKPQSAEVTWQGGMHFQANTVTFEHNVRVRSENQLLTTQKLDGVLDRPIDFSNPQLAAPPGSPAAAQNAPQLATVQCYGEAVLDGRQFDETGQQTSIQQMQINDLSIQRQSGAVHGKGPGWIRYVGLAPLGGGPAAFALPGQKPPVQADQRPRLPYSYVHVAFQHEINGNLNGRTMTFSNRTKTVYAPVDNWHARLDAEKPESLGPEGMVLDARQLTVRQMPPRVRGEQGWFELVAQGNVLAEGATFVAVGHRATYSQDKDHLILEGDGRSPAELLYSPMPGGPRSSTKVEKLVYSLGKRHVLFTGTGPFNFEAPRGPAPPPAKQ
ncbi:MAG: hypothetical protein WD845_08750 [Pirellulales bacterium]